MLRERFANILRPITFIVTEDVSKQLENIRFRFENLGIQCNNYTKTLSQKQQEAKTALRLHEVSSFISDIKHAVEIKKIEELKSLESIARNEQINTQFRWELFSLYLV
ncbi:hypothetical protein [Paenibacillus sp. DS2015]|uniref:hypothetical protein n=1 Tax=Paenibacillus sp. DS2015 TaxID=3373917 RepID=UPI003D1D2BDB